MSSEFTIRLIDPAQDEHGDIPALVHAMKQKSESLGRDMWLPPVKDATAAFAFEHRGRHLGGFVYYPVTEFIIASNSPLIVRAGFDYEHRIREVLRQRGAEYWIGFVPLRLLQKHRLGHKVPMEEFMKRLKFDTVGAVESYEGVI